MKFFGLFLTYFFILKAFDHFVRVFNSSKRKKVYTQLETKKYWADVYANRNMLNTAFNVTTEKEGDYMFTDRPLMKSNNDEVILETRVTGKLIHINKVFAAFEVPGYKDPGNVC